jgi:histidinol dehydrogenase
VAVGRPVAEAVNQELVRQLRDFPRRAIAEKSLKGQGVAIVVKDVETGIGVLNLLAPEHAGLSIDNARAMAPKVTSAGAVFVGHAACESLGDYYAGPSHVLPTGGSARFSSPLGVGDFMKRTSFIEYDQDALSRQAKAIAAFAKAEGLEGHGRAVLIRAKK